MLKEDSLQRAVSELEREVEGLSAGSRIEEASKILREVSDQHPQTKAAQAAQSVLSQRHQRGPRADTRPDFSRASGRGNRPAVDTIWFRFFGTDLTRYKVMSAPLAVADFALLKILIILVAIICSAVILVLVELPIPVCPLRSRVRVDGLDPTQPTPSVARRPSTARRSGRRAFRIVAKRKSCRWA